MLLPSVIFSHGDEIFENKSQEIFRFGKKLLNKKRFSTRDREAQETFISSKAVIETLEKYKKCVQS